MNSHVRLPAGAARPPRTPLVGAERLYGAPSYPPTAASQPSPSRSNASRRRSQLRRCSGGGSAPSNPVPVSCHPVESAERREVPLPYYC